MQKYQYFNGVKFTRDDKTGYYLNSSIRKRMHRYVWEYYNGEIPEGYQIHHKDKDKSNNDISNLEAIPFSNHAKLHNKERAETRYDGIVANLRENALPKAVEWHKSDEGRQWHKEHYEKTKHKLHMKQVMICEMCDAEYIGKLSAENRFCSNKCKSAWRRKNGLDNETRKCAYCGAEFITSKYSKAQTCSRACANKKRTLK
jgi:hypothetical protein